MLTYSLYFEKFFLITFKSHVIFVFLVFCTFENIITGTKL